MALAGTATMVMAEGRRMMRLQEQLPRDEFAALLVEYKRLLERVFEEFGGEEVSVSRDTALATFPTATEAALAAVAVRRAVGTHAWPGERKVEVSIGLESGQAGVGWAGPAAERCVQLCDAAEGGQIFLSPATASLLGDEDLGDLSVQDLGEVETRRTAQAVRAYELIAERH